MKKFLLFCIFLFPVAAFAYPGCGPDMIIGGQIWASCNSTMKGVGSLYRSGWFFAGEKFPVYSSQNEVSNLDAESRNRANDKKIGPCAKGYRIPNRGDWETALWYARLNETNIARLLNLPRNGGFDVYTDKEVVIPVFRKNTLGSYWTSTVEDIFGKQPIILHLGSPNSYTYMDSTDPAGIQPDFLSPGIATIANVRCIRK